MQVNFAMLENQAFPVVISKKDENFGLMKTPLFLHKLPTSYFSEPQSKRHSK